MNKKKQTERSLVFIHIPKAAGTTLNRIIRRKYSKKNIFEINGANVLKSIDEFKNMPESTRRKIKVVMGHMEFGLHRFLPQPADYITLLRRPVDRIIAHYYYAKRRPDHYLYDWINKENISLKNYISSKKTVELNNGQTRLLSASEDVGFGACSVEHLEKAKKNIKEHFAVAGLTERFDETLMLIKKAFGWSMPYYAKTNVRKKRPHSETVEKETLKIIEEYNKLDIALYQYVSERFELSIKQQDFGYDEELEKFKKSNRLHSMMYLTPIQTALDFMVRTYHKLPLQDKRS